MKRFLWVLLTAVLICICAAAMAQADAPSITRVTRDPYGDVSVAWTGGQAPFTLKYYAVDGDDSTVWTVDSNMRSRSGLIEDLAPGFGYVIAVMDDNGDYDVYELAGNNKRFTAVSGMRLTLTLRQRVNGRSSTIQRYSAFDITNSMTNGNLYGATVKLSGYNTNQPLPFTFRMAVTYPDGEPLVFYWDRINLPRGNARSFAYWEFFDFSDLWGFILQSKGEIPTGSYTYYIYMDDGLVATAPITIGR